MTNIVDLPVEKTKVELLLLKPQEDLGYLVAVFKRSAKNGDTWYAFPGGKYAEKENPDETIVDGALRESDEELGIKPKLLVIFAETLRHPKTPTTETHYVLAKCEDGQNPKNIDPAENGELLWVAPVAASKLIGDRAPQEIHDYLAHIARPK